MAELFNAAHADGWQERLASPPVHRFARAAAAAWDALPELLSRSDDPGRALRVYVDQAHMTALDAESFAQAGLMSALAERALTRVLVPRLQTASLGLHQISVQTASKAWEAERETPRRLGAAFLREAIRSLTLHLVLRDGPQLVGTRLGGARAVQDFAWDIAAMAVSASQPGYEVLLENSVDDTWPDAVAVAWTNARSFATLSADTVKKFESGGSSS